MSINIKELIDKNLTLYLDVNIALPESLVNAYVKGYLDSFRIHGKITEAEYNAYIKKYIQKVYSEEWN